ncbi:major facilitator superfamily domain-containing protein [Rhodocollybia butyracea]|uniref:Major facilitator superfamily domain-containing protein n=1 Tax=Rhodocollybia butyracea TaxID=206335 RepID=A0A9P5U0R9_9AGAR|nr:major facilitator superfamily domain-containing protein [Rhodocollybia butyracea]
MHDGPMESLIDSKVAGLSPVPMAVSHSNLGESSTTNETTPLLNNARNDQDPEDQEPLVKEATPLPMLQLLIICFIRLMDPISFTQIFPYVNEFITFLKVTDDPSQTGFYSGLVDFSRFIQWSKLSNKIGRKPVIMAGTLGVALSTMYFGLSSSLTELLVSRAIAGVSGGTVAVVQSVVGEITDASNQAAAFPIYGLVWPVGGIAGPFIGGVLSNPADKYDPFFQNSVFHIHPYFLPCLVAGTLALCGVVSAYLFLEETLHRKPSDSTGSNPADDHEPTLRELLSIPIIRVLTISAFAFNFNGTGFEVLFVLFCYTPIVNGGLEFSPSTIGFILSYAGLISAAMQVFIMPVLLKRVEASKLYNIAISAWPISFAFLPILNFIARRGLGQATGNLDLVSGIMLWAILVFVIAMSGIGGMAYSPAALAVSNGVILCAMSLARIISPALVRYVSIFSSRSPLMILRSVRSSIFALSQEYHLLEGYLWSLCMICSSVAAMGLGRKISRLSQSSLTHYTPRNG